MKRVNFIVPLISAFCLTFASCGTNFFSTEGEIWGTFYHIVYRADRPLDDSIAAQMIFVDNEFSLFNPSSTLSRVNRGEIDSVGPHFRRAFDMARQVWQASGARYDVSVGPLSELWGFGSSGVEVDTPTDSMVAEVLRAVGMGECSVDSTGRLHKKSEATIFDFSSIAKGYGIDLVGLMFERNGVDDYMIEIGGEVLARGNSPRGQKWRIQIDAPVDGPVHEQLRVVELGPERQALASSGNYRNFRTDSIRGRYGHTLSPLTGYPFEGEVIAATVSAPWCALADAYATACMAVGVADSAAAMCSRQGLGWLIVSKKENGCLSTAENL